MVQQPRPSMRSALLLLVAAPAAAAMGPRCAFVVSSRTKPRFSTSLGAGTEDYSHKVLADAGVAKLTNTPLSVKIAASNLPGALTKSGPALAAIARAAVSKPQGREAALAIVRRLTDCSDYDYSQKVLADAGVAKITNTQLGPKVARVRAPSAPLPPAVAAVPTAATSYLDATAGGPPPPVPVPPPPPMPAASTPKPPPGQLSYLDAISEACDAPEPTVECDTAVTSYLDSLSPAAPLSPPSTVAPVSEHPPVPRMNSYLDNMDEAAAITSYLDAVADGERDMAVAAAEASAERVGAVPYLDAMHQACDVDEPDERCDDAVVSYLDALSHGVATPPMAGPGMMSYLDSVGAGALPPAASAPTGGAAGAVVVEAPAAAAPSSATSGSYLDALSSGASPLKHPKSYLDA